jgi:hypothetical protein
VLTHPRHHFQLLLYLVLEPPGQRDAPPASTLLARSLDLFGSATLSPLIPALEGRTWLAWPHDAHCTADSYARRVRARIENCTGRGIWALVFEQTAAQRSEEEAKWNMIREEDGEGARRSPLKRSRTTTAEVERRRRRRRSEAEEGRQRVAEEGWALLEFLVKFWNADAQKNGGVSPAFLAQLWRPSPQHQWDQAVAPIEIVRQAMRPSADASARRVTADLIKLLVSAATTSPPRFLPSNIVLALLPLFDRHLPVFLATLRSAIPEYAVLTHILAHAIEAAAGVRAEREAVRRRRKESSFFEGPGLAPPTVEYTLKLLQLDARDVSDEDSDNDSESESDEEMEEGDGGETQTRKRKRPTPSPAARQAAADARIRTLKLALVTALAANVPSPLWEDTPKRYMSFVRIASRKSDQMDEMDESQETEPTMPLGESQMESQESLGSPEESQTQPTLPM